MLVSFTCKLCGNPSEAHENSHAVELKVCGYCASQIALGTENENAEHPTPERQEADL